MSTDKSVIATIRLLRSRLLKALTQHWYIEQKINVTNTMCHSTNILEYDQVTRTIRFKNPDKKWQNRSKHVAMPRKRAAGTSPLVLVSSCKSIAGGYEALVIGCSNCNRYLQTLFKVGQQDIIPQTKKLTQKSPEKFVCLCTGQKIITTCTPKLIKKDTWMISQIYLNKPIIDFVLSLNKNVVRNLHNHFVGPGRRSEFKVVTEIMMSYNHTSTMYHFMILIYMMLKDGDSRMNILLDFFFKISEFKDKKTNANTITGIITNPAPNTTTAAHTINWAHATRRPLHNRDTLRNEPFLTRRPNDGE